MQSDDDIENTTDNIHIFQIIARPIVCHDIHFTIYVLSSKECILTSHRLSLQSNQCDNDIIYDDKQQYILQTFRYRDLSSPTNNISIRSWMEVSSTKRENPFLASTCSEHSKGELIKPIRPPLNPRKFILYQESSFNHGSYS